MLHEIGHIEIFKNKNEWQKSFSIFSSDCTDGRVKRSKKYQVSLIAEEIDAWRIGMSIAEEAGIKKEQLNNVKLVGTLNYNWKNSLYTLRRDTLYLFDLEVDKKFKPYCLDGEVEKFDLMDWKKVLKLMQNTNSIKNNCNLVFFNFMVRHGLINNKLEKNYEKILRF